MKKFLFTILILAAATPAMFGQSDRTVTEALVEANLIQYTKDAGDFASIYQGIDEPPFRKGIPSIYLRERGYQRLDAWGDEITPTPQSNALSYGIGEVVYDGMKYTEVPLRLDLYRDHLAVMTPNKEFSILLDPAKLDYAEFFGYRVFHLDGSQYGLPEGYYMGLHDGEMQVFKKESFEFNVVNQEFVNWSRKYYIIKDGVAWQVRGKSSIQKALGLNSKDFNAFIRTGRLDLNKNFETALLGIVDWVESSGKN